VNHAGDAIRGFIDGTLELNEDELDEALATIAGFRKAHGPALSRVAAGLRYYVHKHSELMIVGQRLKRTPTIVDKLVRHPKMNLARMHDIAGCRAVVEAADSVYAIAEELARQRRWEVVRTYDYIASPKPDGYRAIHLVIRKDGKLVEIQLRTTTHHAWAEVVEAEDRNRPLAKLKEGRAPDHIVEYYRLGAELLDSQEKGMPVDRAALSRFQDLHRRVSRSQRRRED
jgi:ppGpp synthetase/RelA/SpoT-type nucleotidyltranferase